MHTFFLFIGSRNSPSKNVVDYLLISSMILSLVSLFVNHVTLKLKIFNITAIVILIFTINLLVLNHSSNKILGFLPFKAFFGPLFLWHIEVFHKNKLSVKLMVKHTILVAFLFMIFFYLVIFRTMASSMLYFYLIILSEGIIMLLYGLFALLPRQQQLSPKLKDIISIVSIAFIVDASFTVLNSITPIQSGNFDPQNLSFVNTTFYFISTALGWVYYFSIILLMINPKGILDETLYLKKQTDTDSAPLIPDNDVEELPVPIVESYKKGRLTDDKLEEYEQRLNKLIENEQVYLDNELTLTSLSKKLKMTTHHLTQVLNLRIGLNFYQYINRLRIIHVKNIIDKGIKDDTSIEQLAMRCGFNNRTSFNRYFKEIVGEPPSSYVKSHS